MGSVRLTDVAIVHICENDPLGYPSGNMSQAHFSVGTNYDTLPVLELESQYCSDLLGEDDEVTDNPDPACELRGALLFIANESFRVIDTRQHVGNLFWNGYAMTLDDARRLAVLLRERHGWQLSAWTEGQPFLTDDQLTGAARA